jgi:hypothetical protein
MTRYQVIEQVVVTEPVQVLCRVLHVSTYVPAPSRQALVLSGHLV